MLYPIEELKRNIIKIEHHFLFHILMEQQETNRLLKALQPQKEVAGESKTDDRDLLIKRMNELHDRPRGWHKWNTDKMAEYLKGASENESID